MFGAGPELLPLRLKKQPQTGATAPSRLLRSAADPREICSSGKYLVEETSKSRAGSSGIWPESRSQPHDRQAARGARAPGDGVAMPSTRVMDVTSPFNNLTRTQSGPSERGVTWAAGAGFEPAWAIAGGFAVRKSVVDYVHFANLQLRTTCVSRIVV